MKTNNEKPTGGELAAADGSACGTCHFACDCREALFEDALRTQRIVNQLLLDLDDWQKMEEDLAAKEHWSRERIDMRKHRAAAIREVAAMFRRNLKPNDKIHP